LDDRERLKRPQIWPEHSQAQSEQKAVKNGGDKRAWT